MINKSEFQDKLLNWYYTAKRSMPWRDNPLPYWVWISEVMLQQTRVDTVIPYFNRFMVAVPTVQALAFIDEDELLKLWQGLGYYSRALNLKKGAQMVAEKFGGMMPDNKKDLQALPGIGPYSSGAIASIAFGERVSCIDGNVLRVIARVTANKGDISTPTVKKEIEAWVDEVLPTEHIGDFNQALMELGATVCLPNGEPLCNDCPMQSLCKAYHKGLIAEIPVIAAKKARKIEEKTVLLICLNERFAIRKRDSGGLLPNLWEFPHVVGHLTALECEKTLEGWGITANKITDTAPSKHIFTHLEWKMNGYFVFAESVENADDWIWATKEEIKHKYSIPTAFKGFVKQILI